MIPFVWQDSQCWKQWCHCCYASGSELFFRKALRELFPKTADIASIKLRHNMEWTLRNSKSMGLGFALESMLLVGGSRQEKGEKFWKRLIEWET